MDTLPDDIKYNILMKACIMELKDKNMFNTERVTLIKSIKRIYQMNVAHIDHMHSYLKNELVTPGYGPDMVYLPLIQALYQGFSWNELLYLKPVCESNGWGCNKMYSILDLRQFLSILNMYHPSIPINGWNTYDVYIEDRYNHKFIEKKGTYAKK